MVEILVVVVVEVLIVPVNSGSETGKVGVRAACHYQNQQVETRIESSWELYSDVRDLRRGWAMYPKMQLDIPSQANLFRGRRKG